MITIKNTALPLTDLLNNMGTSSTGMIRLPAVMNSLENRDLGRIITNENLRGALTHTGSKLPERDDVLFSHAMSQVEQKWQNHKAQVPLLFNELDPLEAALFLHDLRVGIFEKGHDAPFSDLGEGWRLTHHELKRADAQVTAKPLFIGAGHFMNLDDPHYVASATARHFDGRVVHSRLEESGISYLEVGNVMHRIEVMVRHWGDEGVSQLGTTGSIDTVRYKFKLPPHLATRYAEMKVDDGAALVLLSAQMLFLDQFGGRFQRGLYDVKNVHLVSEKKPQHVQAQALVEGTNLQAKQHHPELAETLFTSAKMVVDDKGYPWYVLYLYRPFGCLDAMSLSSPVREKLSAMNVLAAA